MNMDSERFITAQEHSYQTALREIKNGKKQSHWMWYIFPQVKGLGRSSTAEYYAIENLDEAKAFLENPILDTHLSRICEALLSLETSNATEVMGRPDDMKLRSSMTLFDEASRHLDGSTSNPTSIFKQVLDKYYAGKRDRRTLKVLGLERPTC